MKIIWCDDRSDDSKEFDGFVRDWKLEDRRADVFTATSDRRVIELLRQHSDVGLLIIDLLWEGQPEHPSTRPVGVDYLENIRKLYPDLRVATRSVISKPEVLAGLVRYFVPLGVTDHFLAHENSFSDLRKRVVLGLAESEMPKAAGALSRAGLGAHIGDQWGAVLFADISGFTLMTEQLWLHSRDALCNALNEFYNRAISVTSDNGGIVDKLIGDEVMAVFVGGPDEAQQRDAARRCIDTSRALLNTFRELERRFHLSLSGAPDVVGKIEWKLKIGVEAGSLFVMKKPLPSGDAEFCVIGRAVNLASRLKGLAGQYSVTLGPTLTDRLTQGPLYRTVKLDGPHDLKSIMGPTPVFRLENE